MEFLHLLALRSMSTDFSGYPAVETKSCFSGLSRASKSWLKIKKQVDKGLLKIAAVMILRKAKSDPQARAFIRRSDKS